MSILSKGALVAAVALAGVALQSVEASAMPIDPGVASATQSSDGPVVQQADWRGGGRHRGFYHRGGYGRHRPFGWHRNRGWHRHWR